MSIDRGYVAQNDSERARLLALVGKVTDAELGRPMPAGWTVAAVLAHLAFWDQRVLSLLDRWHGSPATVPPPVEDRHVDWINDATKPLLLALDPRRAAELTLAIAAAVDREVAKIFFAVTLPRRVDRGLDDDETLQLLDRGVVGGFGTCRLFMADIIGPGPSLSSAREARCTDRTGGTGRCADDRAARCGRPRTCASRPGR